MLTMSPTQRSLKHLRDDGATAAVVERWNNHARIRQDLFGFIDIVALDGGTGVLGVQTTTAKNIMSRVWKVYDKDDLCEIAKKWLSKGNRIEFHGWKKVKNRWRCKIIDLTLEQSESGPSLLWVAREEPEAPESRCKTKASPPRSAGIPVRPAAA